MRHTDWSSENAAENAALFERAYQSLISENDDNEWIHEPLHRIIAEDVQSNRMDVIHFILA
jgi:hypothetical protein